nr:RNA-directed DNA polymerase, eukaryota [Tanacetum cinerariifolium]
MCGKEDITEAIERAKFGIQSNLTKEIGNMFPWMTTFKSRYDSRNDGSSSLGGYQTKILESVFVTNFPEDSTARGLWKVCSDYGTVVDVFIPFKRSKSGKRFAFVRFIKVINLEHLVSNICTIWIGRYHLHANYVRLERPQKPNSSIPRGPNHSTPKETNMENSKKSFVSVLKHGSQSHVTSEITKHALVLDETCIKEFDFGMSLMGRAKDVYAIPNLPCIISKEGFQNVTLSYLGGMRVLFEFDFLASKGKFSIILGLPIKALTPNTFYKIASLWGEYVKWEDADLKSLSCKHLCLKTNMKVIINERQKVIIQGKVYWIHVKELDAWFSNFQEDDQDDLSSDRESLEGDVANKADNNESDVDRVSELSFMHENDTAHKDVNGCKKEEVGSHSEDPLNIYGILDGQKNNVCNSCSDEPKFPPSFTPDNNDQEKNVEENIKDTTQRVQSLSNKLNDRCSNRGYLSQRSMNSHSQKKQVSTCDYFVALMGTWAPTSSKLLIISVYAPQELNERRDLWDYLRTFIDRWEGDTVLMGDFNEVRSAHERFGSTFNRQGAIDFNHFISSACLIDLPLEEVDKPIDQEKSNDEILIKRITLLNDLQEHNNRNAMEISQKAKIRWSIEGDENSKYFHGIMNKKRSQLAIRRTLSNGEWISEPHRVKNDFFTHFKKQFSPIQASSICFDFTFPTRISSDQVQDLERTVTYEEVKRAVWDCGTNKSLGPDGFSFKFYLFIGEWNNNNIQTLLSVLRCFYLALGLKINLHKSKLMEIGVCSNVVAVVASLIGCSILTSPFNYLGVKVGSNMSTITSWDDVISKVSSRLSKWKLKLPSIGGLISLLKSVLTSIPLYHMSIFKVPIGVLNHLESIRQNFFYGVDGSDRKLAWIGWNMVLTSKNNGGLGVSSFFAHNLALFFKWVWRFLTDGSSLWTRFIKAVFGNKGALDTHKLIHRRSPWQDVILAIHSLQSKV